MRFWSSSMTWEQAAQLCTINVNIKTRHLLWPSRSVLKQTQQRQPHVIWLADITYVCLTHHHKSELWVPKEGCESPWQHEAWTQEYILVVRCKENFNDECYVCVSACPLSINPIDFYHAAFQTLFGLLFLTNLYFIGWSSSVLRGCVHSQWRPETAEKR